MFLDKFSEWIDESIVYNSMGGHGGASPAMVRQLKGFTAVDTPIHSNASRGNSINQFAEQAEWTLLQRNMVFDKIDMIAGTPIAERIKSTIIADAFFDLSGGYAMSFKYVDKYDEKKSKKFTHDIEKFLERTKVVDILKDCIANEGMDYAEVFLSTPVKYGIGITEVLDNLDLRELLAIYKNTELVGAVKFKLEGNRAKGDGFLKAEEISHFMLNYRKKPIKISKRFTDKYNITEKIRVAKPILECVIDLIQQYNALEQLQTAMELIKATQGVYLGIGMSPQQDQERVAKQLQEFTLKFNRNRQNVVGNIEDIDVQRLMQSMNQLEFIPYSVEEGTNMIKQVEVKYPDSNLAEILDNLRKTIALSVGIPEQSLSISNSGVRQDKADTINTNPTYSKMLCTIQQLLAKGIRDMLYKHLKYKYSDEQGICRAVINKGCIEILFSATTNLNDRLEDENMLMKAETVGRMLSVVESIASSAVIPVKVKGELLVDYWKSQMHKDVHLRDVIEMMSPEEQRKLELMMTGQSMTDGGEVEEPEEEVEIPTDEGELKDSIDVEKEEDETKIETEEEIKEEQPRKKMKKGSKKIKRKHESNDIRDVFE